VKTARLKIICGVILITVLGTTTFAQGPLTPSGAPAPTMKTLSQIEPRTAIATNIFTITQPGSYYLATNMTGLSIQSGDVTVDLMGFKISAADGSAIYFYSAYTNVVIRNGTLSSLTGSGIYCAGTAANARGLIEHVRIQNCSGTGLYLPAGYIVRDCEIYGCAFGIQASGAIDVRNCRLESNGTALILPSGSTVIGNTIVNNTGDGLRMTGSGSYVADNIVKGNRDNYNISAGNQLNLLLSQIPETLDWPCSVKLAGSLTCTETGTNGITVNSNDVTIDLAGHTLNGPGSSSGNGIFQNFWYRNLTVLNGKVTNWRGASAGGLHLLGYSARILGVQAVTNGYYGIIAGDSGIIRDCIATHNANMGIQGYEKNHIRDCVASHNGETGILAGYGSTVVDCTAEGNANAGIRAPQGCTISRCTVNNNKADGIYTVSASTVSGCTAHMNIIDGIQVGSDSFVTGNTCNNNGYTGDGAGIHASGGDNRIADNNATDNDRGIHVPGSGNFIARNTCSGNTTNWVISANNKVGTIIVAPNSAAISGNSGGTGVGSTDPWANFTY